MNEYCTPGRRWRTRLQLHKFRGTLAKLRCLWHAGILGRDCELCYGCGRPYELWWCDSAALWSEVTGYADNGLCCPDCFRRRADAMGIIIEMRATVYRRR